MYLPRTFSSLRKWMKWGFWLWVLNVCFLGWLGSKALVGPDLTEGIRNEEGWIRAVSQLSTIGYFAGFYWCCPVVVFWKQD